MRSISPLSGQGPVVLVSQIAALRHEHVRESREQEKRTRPVAAARRHLSNLRVIVRFCSSHPERCDARQR